MAPTFAKKSLSNLEILKEVSEDSLRHTQREILLSFLLFILLLEPNHFEDYPICPRSLDFMIQYAKKNISDIQIYNGNFKDFKKQYDIDAIQFCDFFVDSGVISSHNKL